MLLELDVAVPRGRVVVVLIHSCWSNGFKVNIHKYTAQLARQTLGATTLNSSDNPDDDMGLAGGREINNEPTNRGEKALALKSVACSISTEEDV